VNSAGVISLTRILIRALYLFVAAAVAVVDAQDGVEIIEELGAGQELADHLADDRRTPLAAADGDPEADLARRVAHRLRAKCRGRGSPCDRGSRPVSAILKTYRDKRRNKKQEKTRERIKSR